MPATLPDTALHLSALVGPDFVRTEGDQCVVSPANTAEVSGVLSFANANQLTVTPAGGDTKHGWGNAVTADVKLDTTRMNRVLEHPWQDLTCTVQAGCTWQNMQDTLAQHGQFVALDPLFADRASVGGILAANDSGALRHRYGSLRDLVIGMTLVLADGTIAKTGGKVVKNVAGYDLAKLFTGSLGTLGIITEANFRLHPLPQHLQTFTISAPKAAALTQLMQFIRGSHLITQAIQVRGDIDGFHLDIQLSSHPEAKQAEILRTMTEAAHLALAPSSHDVWSARESLFEGSSTVLKIGVLPAQLCAHADFLHTVASSIEVTSVAQSFGLQYVRLRGDESDIKRLIEMMRKHATNSTTTVTVINSTGDITPFSASIPNAFPVMQAVKQKFDPNKILNPGRFLGGI